MTSIMLWAIKLLMVPTFPLLIFVIDFQKLRAFSAFGITKRIVGLLIFALCLEFRLLYYAQIL